MLEHEGAKYPGNERMLRKESSQAIDPKTSLIKLAVFFFIEFLLVAMQGGRIGERGTENVR